MVNIDNSTVIDVSSNCTWVSSGLGPNTHFGIKYKYNSAKLNFVPDCIIPRAQLKPAILQNYGLSLWKKTQPKNTVKIAIFFELGQFWGVIDNFYIGTKKTMTNSFEIFDI